MKQYVTAKEVADACGVSATKAYKIIRELNAELKAAGYITVAGKCPAAYFKEKFYGYKEPGGGE